MDLIVIVDKNNAIGCENKLLANIPSDLKRFKEITTNGIVVMGRKTYESLPKRPLPNRENVVISTTARDLNGAKTFSSIESFFQYAKSATKKIFVLGGGEIYATLLPYCENAYITEIQHTFKGDTFFPNFSQLPNWELAETSKIHEENGYKFIYKLYKNTTPNPINQAPNPLLL